MILQLQYLAYQSEASLFKDKNIKSISSFSASEIEKALNEAQKVGAKSCSYEGARGMMQDNG